MCVDLFLTKSPSSFQKSIVVETDLSEFHKLIVTVIKSYSTKRTPNIFTLTLILTITNWWRFFQFTKTQFAIIKSKAFTGLFKIAFEKRAPLKKNYLRTTHSKFVSIDISNLIYSISSGRRWNQLPAVKKNSKNIINLGKSIKFIKGEEELAKTFSEDFVSILKIFGFNKT